MKQGLWHCFIFNSYMKLCGTYSEMKTITKSLFKVSQPRESYNQLDRRDQVIIFRLRIGHNRLNKHFHRLNIVRSPRCPYGEDDQTADHILQDCRLQELTDPEREHVVYYRKSPGQVVRACGYATEYDFITASGVEV